MIHPSLRIPMEPISGICRQYRVRELAVFGSALRREFTSESDVDMLVEYEPDAPVTFITLSRMQRELSAAIGRPVDLVTKGGLKPLIRDEILSQAEVLYAA